MINHAHQAQNIRYIVTTFTKHKTYSHRTTDSITLQGYIERVMDSESCVERSYMERRFNIYSIIWRYPQLLEDILNAFEDIFK